MGLVINDFRTSHKSGLDPSIINDIFVRDNNICGPIPSVKGEKEGRKAIHRLESSVHLMKSLF